MGFGSRLKDARKRKNMTQSQLAEALRVNSTYVSKLELETSAPSDMLISMASFVLHVDERWLRTGEGTMESRSDRLRQVAIDHPDLQRYIDNIESGASQRDQLARLFAPTYPKPFVLLSALTDNSASDFLARLNLLIKEWIDSKDDLKKRARIEVRMEEAVEDFPVKLAEYKQTIAKRAGDGVVSFDEVASTEPTAAPRRVTLPVMGRAAAGAPKSMISLEGEELRTNGDVAHDIRPGDFIVIADGDSMVDCGIHDGDHCVIHQTPEVANGQIALVAVEDGSTIKRFYKERDGFRLVPCSADHAEQHYPSDAPIRVLGKFVKVIQPDPES